jgi:hypothetical protein
MGVNVYSNEGGEFCNDVCHELCLDNGNVWVVDDLEVAKKASLIDTPWFNASFNKPTNAYVGLLKVVKLTVEEVNEG